MKISWELISFRKSEIRFINRWVRSGKIDTAKVKQDEKPGCKYLLSTSDQHLSAEDIAMGL